MTPQDAENLLYPARFAQENPFEGLPNDVPISHMSRGIERDLREMLDETTLPPERKAVDGLIF